MEDAGRKQGFAALLVAADGSLRSALAEQFARETGVRLVEAASAKSALALLDASAPDVLLLADEAGAAEFLAAARAAGFSGPAIALARGTEALSEEALSEEVDATARLPLRFAHLLALITNLLAEGLATPRLAPGYLAAQHLGAASPLTETEAALLARLARAKGGVVQREALLRDVWGYNPAVSTHTLETHIHRLRRKLESARNRPQLLLTAPGGYRLAPAETSSVLAPKTP